MIINGWRLGDFLILFLGELFDLNVLFFISLFIFGLMCVFKIARRFGILSGHLDVVEDVGVVFLKLVESHLSIVEMKILFVFYGSFSKCIMDLSKAQKHQN